MAAHSKEYTKNQFIKFLNKNNINISVIKKVKLFPETVKKNGGKYDLYIKVTWYDDNKTYYEFEFNYYDTARIEFLFTIRIYTNIDVSVTNLLTELRDIRAIENPDK